MSVGVVPERMGYAAVLYADAAIALLVTCIIPFMRSREEPLGGKAPAIGQPVPVGAAAGN